MKSKQPEIMIEKFNLKYMRKKGEKKLRRDLILLTQFISTLNDQLEHRH